MRPSWRNATASAVLPCGRRFVGWKNESLIISTPRRGSRVAEMSARDCLQVYRVRQMLECTAIDLLGEQKNPALELTRCLREQELLMQQDRPVEEHFTIMSDIHYKLVKLAGNVWIVHHYKSLHSVMARYQILYLNLPGSARSSVEEHFEICASLRDGKHTEAKEQLFTHIESAKARIMCAMQTQCT